MKFISNVFFYFFLLFLTSCATKDEEKKEVVSYCKVYANSNQIHRELGVKANEMREKYYSYKYNISKRNILSNTFQRKKENKFQWYVGLNFLADCYNNLDEYMGSILLGKSEKCIFSLDNGLIQSDNLEFLIDGIPNKELRMEYQKLCETKK